MNDDELRAALERRVAAAPLSADDRNDLIRAARVRATQPPRRSILPRFAGWLAGAAAIVVLVLVALPILLSPPSNSTQPPSTAVAGPTAAPASPLPSSPTTPTGQLRIYSAQELAAMIGNPAWTGKTVLAQASIRPVDQPDCPPAPEPCKLGVLDGVTGNNVVAVGWRDAPYLEGTQYQDDSGTHWVKQMDVPTQPGVFAFTVRPDAAELLGPAQLAADGQALTLADVPRAQERTPTANVYVVSGWYYSGFWPSCPVPQEAIQTPQPDLGYFCEGSWLTPVPPQTDRPTTVIDGALQLPAGPYPSFSDQHSPGKPVQGVYVVRSAGCQIVLEENCPVWRLLGRIDDIAPPVPSPAPSATPQTGLRIYSAQELSDMIGVPGSIGRTVLAEATIGPNTTKECPPPDQPCGLLEDVTGPSLVSIGWRDAIPADGIQHDDGNGFYWVRRLSVPTESGVFAFTVGDHSAEYLGPAITGPEDGPAAVASLLGNPSDPSDNVYVVSGWLTHTLEAPCAFPAQGLESPMPDISSYYCNGSWLTDEAVPPPASGLTFDGGLHVQGDAYNDFAPDPQPMPPGDGPVGYESRQGVYLIRNAGCPEVATGDCPVWRMVGRLDDGAAGPEPKPSSSPPSTPNPIQPSPSLHTIPMPRGEGLEQAIQLARPHVGPDATVWGYAAGTYRDVLDLTPGAEHVLQPPDGITWDSLVWGIVFEGTFDICPPAPASGSSNQCESRPGLSTVYLDFQDGTFLMTAGYSPSPGTPLPTPFYIVPLFGSPAPS